MNNTVNKPILITSGDPAGIGPDIIIQASHSAPALMRKCIVLGDPQVFKQRAKAINLTLTISETKQAASSIAPSTALASQNDSAQRKGHIHMIPLNCPDLVTPGVLNKNNSSHVLDMITQATDGCLSAHYHAMVTAPVHKGIIIDAGFDFSGHTEWIANQCNVDKPVMMLADDHLKVCLATTHLPLRAVADAIDEKNISQVLKIMHNELKQKFNLTQPHIGVCGLNPHAGESGHLGSEEIDIIEPTLNQLRQQGLHLTGPLPADTIFVKETAQQFDAILAMYHDQGLPVIKQHGFGQVVNITLGLPIIRTSVDHGTALNLAASGKASEDSLIAAIKLAASLTPTL